MQELQAEIDSAAANGGYLITSSLAFSISRPVEDYEPGEVNG